MSVEEELIEATGFNAKAKYATRQDFLAALARAVGKLSDDDYDLISNEAAEWYEGAFKALKEKEEIPDFIDAEDEDEAEEVEVNGIEDEGELNRELDEVEAQEDVEQAAAEEEPEPEPVKKPKKERAKKAKSKKGPTPTKLKDPADYEQLTGEKDRFGVYIGTKVHEAVKMYERGTTARELKETLGGRYYNILTKLAKDGHHIIREDHVITLIHRDDYGKNIRGAA